MNIKTLLSCLEVLTMQANKTTNVFNTKYYEKIKGDYLIWVVRPHYYISKLSPRDFQNDHPAIVFAAVPMEDGVHWGFKTKQDLETFQEWANE